MIHQYTDCKNKGGVDISNGMLPQLLHSAVVRQEGEQSLSYINYNNERNEKWTQCQHFAYLI